MTEPIPEDTISTEEELHQHLAELDKDLDIGKSGKYAFEVQITRVDPNNTQIGYNLQVMSEKSPQNPKELWATLCVLEAGIQKAKESMLEVPGKLHVN